MESIEHIENLVDKSVWILRETKAQFKNPCVLWSSGKDSTAMLGLLQDAFFGTVPFPVVHIDTGWKFQEIYDFRDKVAKEWGLNLIVAKHPQAGVMNPTKGSTHEDCCSTLKTKMLQTTIEKQGFDAVIVSIRRDEHYIRNMERVISPRDKSFKWKFLRPKEDAEDGDAPFVSLQGAELWDYVESDFGEDLHHVRVHALLHWTELETWLYTKLRKLPVNPLYFAKKGKRFRSLGCWTCTKPVESKAANIDAIIKELKTTKVAERAGRSQDKEKQQVMRKLRSLGYM